MVRFKQCRDVVDRRQAAAGDHGDRRAGGERCGRLEVQSFENAVAVDVGVDDGGDAGILEPGGDLAYA